MNFLGGTLNKLAKRKFTGSLKLLIFSMVGFILMYYVGPGAETFLEGLAKGWWLWMSMLIYILSSLTPEFLNIKRANSKICGEGFFSILTGVFLGVAAVSSSTDEYIVTKWSDGTVTKTADLSGGAMRLFTMAIIILLMIALGLFISVFAAIHFVRNYIIYN